MHVVLPTYISRIPDCGWGHMVCLTAVTGMRSSTTEVCYKRVPTHMSQFETQLGSDEIKQRSHDMHVCNRAHKTRARELKLFTTRANARDDRKHVQLMRGHVHNR